MMMRVRSDCVRTELDVDDIIAVDTGLLLQLCWSEDCASWWNERVDGWMDGWMN